MSDVKHRLITGANTVVDINDAFVPQDNNVPFTAASRNIWASNTNRFASEQN